MKLGVEFLGAAGQVTGSKSLLHYHGKKYLIDCGLFQGTRDLKERNWAPFSFPLDKIEKVFLTHAHLDHSGMLPRLINQGYKGEILCTSGTADLLEVMLLDAAHLQEEHSQRNPCLH